MSKLLIYIGEGIKFDLDETISAIKDIDGVTDAKSGDLSAQFLNVLLLMAML